jgi:hypothetical protein
MPAKTPAPAPMTLVAEFQRDKETPGAVRYKEVPAEGGTPVIGSFYVRKSSLPDEGKGIDYATVTVELR